MTVPEAPRWGDVAIGAAVRSGESAADTVARLRSRWASWERWWTRWESEADSLRYQLAVRGAAERRRGRHLLDEVVAAVAAAPVVERIVDAQVERVLRLLENEPERIRVLVRGQRDTIVDEVVGRVRAGAAAGDEAVERFALKISRREPTDSR